MARIYRGRLAGLLTCKFLAEMTELPVNRVKVIVYTRLRKEGRTPQSLSPREIARFIENAYEFRKRHGTENIDSLVDSMFD